MYLAFKLGFEPEIDTHGPLEPAAFFSPRRFFPINLRFFAISAIFRRFCQHCSKLIVLKSSNANKIIIQNELGVCLALSFIAPVYSSVELVKP
jgi:hypothetical protein